MGVGPHPHIGLQTFTWMIEGAVMIRARPRQSLPASDRSGPFLTRRVYLKTTVRPPFRNTRCSVA
jgi:redox-sensitive bicupin YhaK (pirin superfamily)